MTPQDVIRAIERWKMVLRPCVAGKTWSAQTWVAGVLVETRKHANVTCAVRTLNYKLDNRPAAELCCGDAPD